MRDRILIGIRDKQVSQKLQMRSDLTLRTAIEMARHCELIKSQNTEGEKHAQHVDNIKSVKKNVHKRTGYSGRTFIKTKTMNVLQKGESV